MIWRHGLLLTLCLALGAVAAFYFPISLHASSHSWTYADLRLLDPPDVQQPTLDLLAIYTRSTPDALELRLDMLEHAATPDYDLYLALDNTPGGIRSLPVEAVADLDWDVLLVIPATGDLQALDSQMQPIPGAGLRVVRDPTLDQILISLNWAGRNARLPNLQAFVTPASLNHATDRSDPAWAGAPSPPQAQVLLAFWNTYPAYTPATALRRWNGAHTGPLGGSHGLLHLLRAARAEGAPLVLLDLRYPASLSALDFIGGLGLVRQMAREGLLILPEYLPPYDKVEGQQALRLKEPAAALKQIARDFGLPPSRLLFARPEYLPVSPDSALLLADLTQDAAQPESLSPVALSRWGALQMLPIQAYRAQENQAQNDGPSLEARRALSQAALAAARSDGQTAILILGGELPASTWGAPKPAGAALHYLKSRPWIRLLNAQDLLAMRATQGVDPPTLAFRELASPDDLALLEALNQAPENPLSQAAWQAALALFAPVYPTPAELPALRAGYHGQAWSLLAAAHWIERPVAIASCAVDPDRDGQPECLWASDQLYAQFEIESGALTFLFRKGPSGDWRQVIGPSSQIISGLSNPQSWKLDSGQSAEPEAIAGAFAETGVSYRADLDKNRLTFSASDGGRQKIYVFGANWIMMSYRARQPTTLQIPVLLDPWERFSPDWSARYRQNASLSGWTFRLEGAQAGPLSVEIRSNAALSAHTFSEAASWVSRAEDPNQDYPPGFYLPFPLAEVRLNISSEQDTIVEIRFVD
jgi:hypothetical protein